MTRIAARYGRLPELARFGLVGTANTAFAFGLFVVLQLTLGTLVHYLVVLVVTNVLAVLLAYVLQRRLVFRFTGGWWPGLARFGLVYLIALGINMVLLPALHELLGIPVIPAQAMVTVLQAFGTYAAHRLFTFRHAVPEPNSPDGSDLLPGGDKPR